MPTFGYVSDLSYTVETRIKELRYFLSNLDGFLISGLVLSIPAYKVLTKVLLYSTSFACIYIVFSRRIIGVS